MLHVYCWQFLMCVCTVQLRTWTVVGSTNLCFQMLLLQAAGCSYATAVKFCPSIIMQPYLSTLDFVRLLQLMTITSCSVDKYCNFWTTSISLLVLLYDFIVDWFFWPVCLSPSVAHVIFTTFHHGLDSCYCMPTEFMAAFRCASGCYFLLPVWGFESIVASSRKQGSFSLFVFMLFTCFEAVFVHVLTLTHRCIPQILMQLRIVIVITHFSALHCLRVYNSSFIAQVGYGLQSWHPGIPTTFLNPEFWDCLCPISGNFRE